MFLLFMLLLFTLAFVVKMSMTSLWQIISAGYFSNLLVENMIGESFAGGGMKNIFLDAITQSTLTEFFLVKATLGIFAPIKHVFKLNVKFVIVGNGFLKHFLELFFHKVVFQTLTLFL